MAGKKQQPARIAVIGIGNTLAGNDGAGIVAVKRLEKLLSAAERTGCLFAALTGDLFGVTDYLEVTTRIVFIDAVAGCTPGALTVIRGTDCPPPPSFHQFEISTVMESLRRLRIADPFPPWEVRGITITPPDRLREGLDPLIDRAVDRLTAQLAAEIRAAMAKRSWNRRGKT